MKKPNTLHLDDEYLDRAKAGAKDPQYNNDAWDRIVMNTSESMALKAHRIARLESQNGKLTTMVLIQTGILVVLVLWYAISRLL